MADVSKRRRQPRGVPTGGEFADELRGGMAVSDLERDEPLGFDPKHLSDDDKRMLHHIDGMELRDMLALHEPAVDRALAFNPNMDWDMLDALYGRQRTDDMRGHILNGMCGNPSSAGHLDELYERARTLKADGRRTAYNCMAKNPALNPHMAARLLDSCGRGRAWLEIPYALARNPNTGGETLAQIALRNPHDRLILRAVIDNPNADDNALLAAGDRTDDRLDQMDAYGRMRRIPDGLDPGSLPEDSPIRRGLENNPNLMSPDRLAESAERAFREGPIDPNLALRYINAPACDTAVLDRLAVHCARNPRVQSAILTSPACDDAVRLTVAEHSETPEARQYAWRSMKRLDRLDRLDTSDHMSLIGVCANPNMTEPAALELRRLAGDAAVARLKDNPTLPKEFRRAL